MQDYTAAIELAKILIKDADEEVLTTLADIAGNEAFRRTNNPRAKEDIYLIATMIQAKYDLLDIGQLKSQSIGPTISETYNVEYPAHVYTTLAAYNKTKAI